MKRYVGQHAGQYILLTVHDDGTHELATRADPWDSWGEPTFLEREIPQQRGASA